MSRDYSGSSNPNWRGGTKTQLCVHCQQPFSVKRHLYGIKRYCSNKCKYEHMKKEKIKRVCIQCGSTFMVDGCRKNKFCTLKCSGDYKRSKTPIVECDQCGKNVYRIKSRLEKYERCFCNRNCYAKWKVESGFVKGKKNPNYIHGKGYTCFRGKDWDEIRKVVLERDEYVCQKCGFDEGLAVHHIIPYRERDSYKHINDKYNLVTLCKRCHSIEENKYRKYGINHTTVTGHKGIKILLVED